MAIGDAKKMAEALNIPCDIISQVLDRYVFKGQDINGQWYEGLLSISRGYEPEQPAMGCYISNGAGMPWAYLVRPETVTLVDSENLVNLDKPETTTPLSEYEKQSERLQKALRLLDLVESDGVTAMEAVEGAKLMKMTRPLKERIESFAKASGVTMDEIKYALQEKPDTPNNGQITPVLRSGKLNLDYIAKQCVAISKANGWDVLTQEDWFNNNVHKIPAVLALIYSEVSEALEAYRKNDPNNFTEELADIIIRTLDCAGGLRLDIHDAVMQKMEKNKQRGYKHGNKKV